MIKLDIQHFGGRGASSSANGDKLVSKEEQIVGGKVDLNNPTSLAKAVDGLPYWFISKNFPSGSNEAYIRGIAIDEEQVYKVGETDKAIRVKYKTNDYGSVTEWIPKKLLPQSSPERTLVTETYKLKNPIVEKHELPYSERGLKYNEHLKKYAKQKGVKGIREMMKTDTIINKIKKAGYEVPDRNSIDYTYTTTKQYRYKRYYK